MLRPDVSFTFPKELNHLAVPMRKDGKPLTENDLRLTIRYSGRGRYDLVEDEVSGRKGRLWWNDLCYWDNVP